MTTQTTEIVVRTKYDHLTMHAAREIIERVQLLLTYDIPWIEVVDLCCDGATVEDAVQYTIDTLNDECPEGYYYYLTADCNLACDVEDDS